MKIIKSILLATVFISSFSFANATAQEKVKLTTLIDVISFCSSDKSCTSIRPFIAGNKLNYDVEYQSPSIFTDPAEEDPDD